MSISDFFSNQGATAWNRIKLQYYYMHMASMWWWRFAVWAATEGISHENIIYNMIQIWLQLSYIVSFVWVEAVRPNTTDDVHTTP